MKLRSISIAVFTLLAGTLAAHAAPQTVAGQPVIWSLHFDANRLRTGVGKELGDSLLPILDAVTKGKSGSHGGALQSLAFYGFEPTKDNSDDDFPFAANFTFSPENGGISQHFDDVAKKHGATTETIAGYPAVHFDHEGKEIWIAKTSDTQLYLATSRVLMETVLRPDAGGLPPLPSSSSSELLAGNIDIARLLADHGNVDLKKSELLKMLPHLDFHIDTADDQLGIAASADLDNERNARRAAQMIEGMVAAVAMHDTTGVPWDERLKLDREGSHLALQIRLDPGEAKTFFDHFARQIEIHHGGDKAGHRFEIHHGNEKADQE